MAHIGKQSKQIIYSVYTYLKNLVSLYPTATIGDLFSKTQLAAAVACGVSRRTVQRVCEGAYAISGNVEDDDVESNPYGRYSSKKGPTPDELEFEKVIAEWKMQGRKFGFLVYEKKKEEYDFVKLMQRQNANGASSTLPTDAAEGESSSSVKNEQSTASQPNTSTSVAEEPKPKIAKISKPPIEKVPTPSLIVAGPRQRKPTQPYSPAVTATAVSDEYVFEGWRLVNMGYFIKSLQTLNDHEGRECNFSDMKVLAETSDKWNVGIVFSCKLCPTTKVIWMENPNCKEAPSSPIIIKRRASAALVRPPIAPANKTRKPKKKVKSPAPPSMTPKSTKQPNRSKRKAPTPPPDIATAAPISQQKMTIQVDQHNYPQQLIIRPNLTLRYGQPPTPFVGQLQPLVNHQVPNIAQSQVIGSVIGQTQIIQQFPGSVIGQSQVPPVPSIKQEIILPDDGSIPSFINSSEPTRVEMSFCVDQDESGGLPTDTGTPVDVVTKDTALTPATLPLSSGQLSSTSAMDTNTTHAIAPTIALSVDLNLVKKEVDEETPPCQQNISS